jgi:hypothetical protein
MRPLDLGQTIDASMKIVQQRWKTLALLILVVVGPLQLASLVITATTTDHWSLQAAFGDQTKVKYDNESAYAAGQVAILALTFLSYLLGTVACYRAVADTYLGRETGLRASLEFALERLGATLWLSILLATGLVAGFLAFVLPGVWLLIAWSVAVPAMLVEGARGSAALRRSYDLTKDRWWATLGRFFVAYVLVYVAATAVTLAVVALAVVVVDESSLVALALQHVGELLGSLITTPFLAAVTVLVYFDLRVRKERFDPAGGPAPEADEPSFGGFLPPSAPEAR